MIISDSHRFVFIHNPKCAGTTIRNSLMPMNTRDNFYWMYDGVDGVQVDKAHLTASVLKRFRPDDFLLLSSFFTFGAVRNPFDRVVSAFNEGHSQLYRDYSVGKASLDRYRDKLNRFVLSLTRENTTGLDFRNRHCVQQKEMFYFADDCLADQIIKVEQLEAGAKQIADAFPPLSDATSQWTASVRNRKQLHHDLEELLSDPAIGNITEVYAEDFETFQYDRECPVQSR